MTLSALISSFEHDARAALGSLRLVLGTLPPDTPLIEDADREVRALTALLPALTTAAGLSTQHRPLARVDLATAVAAAANGARARGAEVRVADHVPPGVVVTAPAELADALMAVFVAFAGSAATIRVAVTAASGRAVVRCTAPEAPTPLAARLASFLIDHVGGVIDDLDGTTIVVRLDAMGAAP